MLVLSSKLSLKNTLNQKVILLKISEHIRKNLVIIQTSLIRLHSQWKMEDVLSVSRCAVPATAFR